LREYSQNFAAALKQTVASQGDANRQLKFKNWCIDQGFGESPPAWQTHLLLNAPPDEQRDISRIKVGCWKDHAEFHTLRWVNVLETTVFDPNDGVSCKPHADVFKALFYSLDEPGICSSQDIFEVLNSYDTNVKHSDKSGLYLLAFARYLRARSVEEDQRSDTFDPLQQALLQQFEGFCTMHGANAADWMTSYEQRALQAVSSSGVDQEEVEKIYGKILHGLTESAPIKNVNWFDDLPDQQRLPFEKLESLVSLGTIKSKAKWLYDIGSSYKSDKSIRSQSLNFIFSGAFK
jgi:hypothetical protein